MIFQICYALSFNTHRQWSFGRNRHQSTRTNGLSTTSNWQRTTIFNSGSVGFLNHISCSRRHHWDSSNQVLHAIIRT